MTIEEYISNLTLAKYTIATTGMQGCVDMAMLELSLDFYGEFYNKAVALYALHNFVKGSSDFSNSGIIKSERAKNWAVTYETGSGSDILCSTSFGSQLSELNKNLAPIARTSYTPNNEPSFMCGFHYE